MKASANGTHSVAVCAISHLMRCLLWASAALICSPPVCEAAVVTYKDGSPAPFLGGTYSGTRDAAIVTGGGNTTDNLGARGDFEVGVLGPAVEARRHAVVRFDITSLAGQFLSINSVRLRLYPSFVQTSAADAIELYRLAPANSGWVEGNGTSFTGFGPEDVGGSTWGYRIQGSSQFTGTQWAGSPGASTAGTDYLTPALAVVGYNSSTPLQTAFDLVFNDASFISTWASGNNPGLFLKSTSDASVTTSIQRIAFSSREGGAGVGLQPELIIDYTPIPEPAGIAHLGMALLLAISGRWRVVRIR
jgi:hypothetical protein